MLDVVDVCKSFGTVQALAGVSFTVREGELFGLLGPNGAGKTTLMSIASALIEPTSGEVRLKNETLHPTRNDIKLRIGIVPQELAIYGELTARENLRFFGELYGVRDLERRAAEVLELVGLTERANDRASTFSGGMKRRLNLGVALVHRPTLLLLDEPTAGVDPQSRNHLFEGIRTLNEGGTTIVYTSHYMEEVQSLCTRIGILDHGKLIACDALPRLLELLPGSIRLEVAFEHRETLADALEAIPDIGVCASRGDGVEIQCPRVPAALTRVMKLLAERGIEPTRLETREPNLERVFLHLTGRELRD
jgi:ABC-2 type transport system ATP-binding protein